jgi:hypothetical protein
MIMSETPEKKKARLRYDNIFKTAWTVVRDSSGRPTATASPQKPSDGRGISNYMD